MDMFSGLFGGGKKPDTSKQDALAAKNAEDIEKRRADEQTKKDSQLALLRGLQGKGGESTMFDTGTQGLSEKLG